MNMYKYSKIQDLLSLFLFNVTFCPKITVDKKWQEKKQLNKQPAACIIQTKRVI